jgi:hypothetical protein
MIKSGNIACVAHQVGQADRMAGTGDMSDMPVFVHLPFLLHHAACLDFHDSQRRVRTASVAQVSQPYSGSAERWRHYEKFLGPLLDALGEFAPPR